MSVMKEDGTKRLIDQILASLKIGKYAIMDKVLNINSKNPVENGVITQAINGINNALETKSEIVKVRLEAKSVEAGKTCYWEKSIGRGEFVIVGFEVGVGAEGVYEASARLIHDGSVYPNARFVFKSELLNNVQIEGYNNRGTTTTLSGWLYLARVIEEV